jgi:enoyl-CoA hydratase/carnithine racemase
VLAAKLGRLNAAFRGVTMSEPEPGQIRYEVVDGVATITFDRPDKLNAFDGAMLKEFIGALDRADADDAVRALVVTGAGRAFCAGADISGGSGAFEPGAARGPEPRRDGGGRLALRIFAAKKPVIGAINGAAVGMGATMTLPMDIRLGTERTRFSFPFTRRGIVPEGTSSWFLPRVVGIGTASEWMLTGRMIEIAEARAAGLVRSVHEPDELLPAAYAIAAEIRDNTSPVSVALTRRLLWDMSSADPMTAHLTESRVLAERSRSLDAREGVASFLEKRIPHFPMQVNDYDFGILDD